MQRRYNWKLLLLEPNPVEARLFQELLDNNSGISFDVCHLKNSTEVSQQIASMSFDIALVDAMEGDAGTLALLHSLHSKAPHLPVVMLMEMPDPPFVRQAREAGVQDCMLKFEVDRVNLLATIQHAISRRQGVVADAKSRPLKEEDELSRLPGRAEFVDHLEYEINRARRYSQLLALMFIHIDNLTTLSSRHGKKTVESLLSVSASRLKQVLRGNDLTGRYSDDEFACILVDLANEKDVDVVINKVLTTLHEPIPTGQTPIQLNVQIGVGLYPKNSSEAQELIRCAQAALNTAKSRGSCSCERYSSCARPQELEHFKIAQAVRHAISHDRLCLYLQPVLDLNNKKPVSVEALIYWNHPDYREVSSRDFMFLAELGGLIWPVTEWLLRKSCEQYRVWQKQGMGVPKLRLPVVPKFLRKNDFPEMVKNVLIETGVSAQALELTVPLSTFMHEADKIKPIMNRLASLGVSFLLNNFGSSKVPLSTIQGYPVKGVIIDDNLVHRIVTDEKSKLLVKTIVSLCHSLQLSVTANGVALREQEKLLSAWQCPNVQGELYGDPVEAKSFMKLAWMHPRPPGGTTFAAPDDGRGNHEETSLPAYLESLNSLPALSATSQKLLSLRNDPDLNIRTLSQVIANDPAIAAQILRYANAPFFGNQGKIKTIEQAVMTALGVDGALNMALGIAVMGTVQAQTGQRIDLQAFWRHALFAATLAQKIASLTPAGWVIPGTAYLAGLLQDIGYLLLGRDFQSQSQQVRQCLRDNPASTITELEKDIIGITHAEVGSQLLYSWHLPEEIVTTVFEHHNMYYVGPHAVYANIVLLSNRLLAPAHLGDEVLRYLPPAMLDTLGLEESQLQQLVTELMSLRNELDRVSKHLAA